ncbi:MAG: RDD family protein [Alphaproteobacteria bacterium]|nr:RDD family protein [Alphaproteobacteria bacterium]
MTYFLRRTAARSIDYLLWGMLTVVILGDKIGDIQAPSLLFYTSFWVYILAEAALISLFGTTLGKKLLGVYIFSQEGKKLSFFRSLKRSLFVFGCGMGFFLPYISLLLPLCAVFWLIKRQSLPWDSAVPDMVDYVKITLWNKLLLSAFILFLGSGYFMTVKTVLLYRQPDFAVLEDSILAPYFEKIRPQLVETLSEEAVLSPQAAAQALERLKDIRRQLQNQQEELRLIRNEMQKQLDKMPFGEWKLVRQDQQDAFFEKMNGFLFAEGMRIRLFENILRFFQTEEKDKYTLIDSRPIFKDRDLQRQYDNYMTQLQMFLLSGEKE